MVVPVKRFIRANNFLSDGKSYKYYQSLFSKEIQILQSRRLAGGRRRSIKRLQVDGAIGPFQKRSAHAGASAHCVREVPAKLGVTRNELRLPGMVPRCEVRHLGALERAMRAGTGRLVCAAHVHGRHARLSISLGALWAAIAGGFQGHR